MHDFSEFAFSFKPGTHLPGTVSLDQIREKRDVFQNRWRFYILLYLRPPYRETYAPATELVPRLIAILHDSLQPCIAVHKWFSLNDLATESEVRATKTRNTDQIRSSIR